jgi:DNA-binding transcriptional ArsR family regulator
MNEPMNSKERDSPGDSLLAKLAALASPHRLCIVAALAKRSGYVSQLAREIGMSRPLLQMHLRKLEAAGLVRGRLELSDEGKAMKFYDLEPFALKVDADAIAEAVQTLNVEQD